MKNFVATAFFLCLFLVACGVYYLFILVAWWLLPVTAAFCMGTLAVMAIIAVVERIRGRD